MELAGKAALVTGASRGIGRAIATALAEAGADVAVVARSEANLADTVSDITALGRRALEIAADVTHSTLITAAIAQAEAQLGPISILINNAGVAPSLKFDETTDDIWARTIQVNLTGAFTCTRAILPGMIARGWGRIINIASTAAHTGYPYNAAYVASKHGLLGLTRALALEVARKGVTVNAICPGFTDTDIADAAIANLVTRTGRTPADARRTLESMSPQARLISPSEVAATVLFLAGEGARGINGQSIIIDGGGVQR